LLPIEGAASFGDVVVLSEVGSDEWQRWRAVRLAALEEAPEAFGSTLAAWSGAGDTEVRWRRRLEEVALNIVALDGGDPVGQVSGDLAPDGRVHVISMWVAPRARGTGAGVALLAAVQTWAASVGAPELALAVKRSNSPAIRLYQRFGFRRSAEAHEDPTEFVMTKPLAEPGASDAPPPGVRTTVSHHASEGEGGGDR
jgi:ribosomal protein S18 acetylase RimI-like enzyme